MKKGQRIKLKQSRVAEAMSMVGETGTVTGKSLSHKGVYTVKLDNPPGPKTDRLLKTNGIHESYLEEIE